MKNLMGDNYVIHIVVTVSSVNILQLYKRKTTLHLN